MNCRLVGEMMNKEQIKLAILKELQRQGVEYAKVEIMPIYSAEIHFVVIPLKRQHLVDGYVDIVRVDRQIAEAEKAIGG